MENIETSLLDSGDARPDNIPQNCSSRVYESLDYDMVENTYYFSEKVTSRQKRAYNALQWLITLGIGILTGFAAFLMEIVIDTLVSLKLSFMQGIINDCGKDCFWVPYVTFVSLNVGLVMIGCFVVLFEPAAASSGVPEVKAYLNGLKVPNIVRLKTLVVKMISSICAVAGGLSIGKEEPMMHIGAVIAAGISQGKSTTFGFDTGVLMRFRNDREKRDYVAGGAAAGLSAAFRSPIGGVLYTIEESASFWSSALTWRTFFCSVVATFSLSYILSAKDGSWNQLTLSGTIDFGSVQKSNYSLVHFPFFIFLGVLGGIFGSIFVFIFQTAQVFRTKYFRSSLDSRILETVICSFFVSSITFIIPYFFAQCEPATGDDGFFPQFYCPQGTYSTVGSIVLGTHVQALRTLFHNSNDYHPAALLICIFYFLVFPSYAAGTFIPAGIFTPCLLVGALYGRLVSRFLSHAYPGWTVEQGTFALVGSASMMSGVTRLTISLTAILVDSTDDVSWGVPIIVAVMIAHVIAENLIPGIYQVVIKMNNIPLLDWEPPLIMKKYHASHVMNTPVICFNVVEKVENIYRELKNTTHNGFAVVNEDQRFVGLILRHQIITLLEKKAFIPTPVVPMNEIIVEEKEFLAHYPRYPSVCTLSLSEDDLSLYINLVPYMNSSPYRVEESCTLERVFKLFRTMGVRHLVVVDYLNKPIGMITRKDLAFLKDRIPANRQRFPKRSHTRSFFTELGRMVGFQSCC